MTDASCLEQFEQYLTDVKKASKNTLSSYLRDVRQLSEYLAANESVSLQTADEDVLCAYIDELRARGKSVATVSRAIASLKNFYLYMRDQGWIEKVPTGKLVPDKTTQKLPQILTSKEVELLLEQPQCVDMKGYRDRAMLELLYATGIRVSELINLEITETAAGKNKTIMIQNMEKLIDKGVTFSLDDFGTGRSNIDYFVNMPVRTIKFDYTFTRGFFDNEKIKHVLTGMLDIIHKMNLSVVVEGIETKEQMEVMKDMEVEFIQGFYYSKPIPENEFMEFLRQNN